MNDETHLAALRTYWRRNQAFPAMAKLCGVVGLTSTSSVFALIKRLSEAGYLERVEGRVAPTRRFFGRPIIGAVRAGLPQLEGQEPPELLTIDDYLVDDPNRTVLCRVRGESMRDVGLLDGDLVVVEKNRPTRPGDIVVAVVDGEMTVKTLCLAKDGAFYLEPANPDFQPIRPQGSLEIVGVVVGAVRRYGR
ncbi:LexA repressor [Caballeronia novacaledonica]|uniref:LexA repressor n=1 Tax=Caballeronia novacaledonica TaxID=1544861 RepID=A0A2U3IC57_9BURK|nr:transcriptional repressor LexA [Caballeronia novacaledonica]SPB17794.1 LexA repressor [Caballeronia novacaledonica]